MEKRLLTHKELETMRCIIRDTYKLDCFYESPDGDHRHDYIGVCANTESYASIRLWSTGHIEIEKGNGISNVIVAKVVKFIKELITQFLTGKTSHSVHQLKLEF